MQLRSERLDGVPRLAWCASLARGDGEVLLRHGSDVVVDGERFFEGAWDGDLENSEPDRARTLVGTAGRVDGERCVFASSTDLHTQLYCSRRGEVFWISNSLAFLLVALEDAPDPAHGEYADDLLDQVVAGIHRQDRTLKTRHGEVELHECGNLTVDAKLRVLREEKPPHPSIERFEDYVELLSVVAERVFANAKAPGRPHCFEPLATVSRGYDAGAVAAIARRRGCTQAITFRDPEDSGAEIAQRLGLSVKEVVQSPFDRQGFPEAEFAFCPPGSASIYLPMETELSGRLLLRGHFGDDLLTPRRERFLSELRQQTLAGRGGISTNEFRLRVGFLDLPLFYAGWQHFEAIQRISCARELAPYSLGGEYDRPIARRILEEAGIPRGAFGMHKLGTAHRWVTSASHLGEESRADYFAFLRSLGLRGRDRLRMLLRARLSGAHRRVTRKPAPSALAPLYRRHSSRPEDAFLFHWGFERIKDRYRLR